VVTGAGIIGGMGMKASEVVEELERMIQLHGDLEVKIEDGDGYYTFFIGGVQLGEIKWLGDGPHFIIR